MARDWTLSPDDKLIVHKYRLDSRLYFALQLCSVRLYGRFLKEVGHVSPRILSYLNKQLGSPPSLTIKTPEREATLSEQRKAISIYLGFEKYDDHAERDLSDWLKKQANEGRLPKELLVGAEQFLLDSKIILPGASILDRLVTRIYNEVQEKVFDSLQGLLSDELISKLDSFLLVSEGQQRSLFYLLKEYPSSASVHTIQHYLKQYRILNELGLDAIQTVRQLDGGMIPRLPDHVPLQFIPKELLSTLKDGAGVVQRNIWELGLAIAVKDALRSGDIYLPKSKQYVSFWDLLLDDHSWKEKKQSTYEEFGQPNDSNVKPFLLQKFHQSIEKAQLRFGKDDFAQIIEGSLKLKKEGKTLTPSSIATLQKTIDTSMPLIRIEQLLIEVDRETGFSRHFVPLQQHRSRPKHFYKTLIAALISQATNLGVVAMSSSVKGITIDMLRHILQYYVREETLKAASADIVNQHHQLPFSAVQGAGHISSSDAQRFKVRADSLLASYYPRYYGYYEKAIGIYTHVSDQYSVYSTKVISCSPREALYVLDGLLENNTILKIREHTTDTHGYTEIIFALCHLLGYYFMPRIRDLKSQQLYQVQKGADYGVFSPLLTKTVNLEIIEEQWESMIRVAKSLKEKTAPAHVIVQRLTSSYPSDRLAKAFTNLGRIIKTEYILRYITDKNLRQKVGIQLNKGEYRHNLPRWIFFANQGEFTTGDYEEIMNKASCLSLVSNAILYWNTTSVIPTKQLRVI